MAAMQKARADDKMFLTQRGAIYVAFLNAGYTSDEANELTEQAIANPDRLLEDCRLGRPRRMKGFDK